jgi:hypothetical protein
MDIFDEMDFGCNVTSATYDLQRGVGHIHMPAGNCTDMDKTIKFFTSQVPTICHIVTWCDGQLDTQYVLHATNDNWIAI